MSAAAQGKWRTWVAGLLVTVVLLAGGADAHGQGPAPAPESPPAAAPATQPGAYPIDLPTALGLLAPDVKLTLINAKDRAFDKTAAIYKLAGAEGKFERK